ncbi:bifunctional 3-(3-hydroxy-phenyl)propionate/3-hydroxycinnamic acid hydroxylase MhpA [Corynebacterium sp. A21]|uniref:bifunctional 3-(3-hydroxy-phenyl)propionate/3-hydroxycinnamic acid hydroxylase MhpA n=1 Tax=Corynebacterium sp. A21 TaxID=3457318 RepID=UPI003FD512FE
MASLTPHPPPRTDFDVAIIGYGPTGRLLALKLGLRGHRVAIVERQEKTYPLPRAVHFDDEIARLFQSVGAGPDKMPHAVKAYDNFYEWRNAAHETILKLDWSVPGPSGWNVSYFFHQPAMEDHLDRQVQDLDSITMLRGWEALSHEESESGVQLRISNAAGEHRELHARYLIGADGANSKVRDWIGTTMTDLGYFHDWLVVDLMPTQPLDIHPSASQFCNPARPTTVVPAGPGRQRFEFMRLEHETKEELNTDDKVWELLAPWGVTPENATVERHVIYTFQARWCDKWRSGRLLLAGDSAHLMPPFQGQGMCSGLRDAVNLEWKLDLVLRNQAGTELLDTYGTERAEHVRHFIERSMQLGEVICLTEPEAVTKRDTAMLTDIAAGTTMTPRPLPRLGDGIHIHDAAGGTLFIQAQVQTQEGELLFDDVFGPSGVLLLADAAAGTSLNEDTRRSLTSRGFQIITLGTELQDSIAVDSTGTYRQWFQDHAARAVLVRPDYYVYGIATEQYSTSQLATDFLHALAANNVAVDQRPELIATVP